MSEHTPGPWKPHQQGDANFYAILHENKWLASIQFNGELMEAKQMANLNVMAAAPELLETLIQARQVLQFANETPNGPIRDTIWMMHGPETLFDFLDAAIAKATGLAS